MFIIGYEMIQKSKEEKLDRSKKDIQNPFKPVIQIEILSPNYITGWIMATNVIPEDLKLSGITTHTVTLTPRPDVEIQTGHKAVGFKIVPTTKIEAAKFIGATVLYKGEPLTSQQPAIFFTPAYQRWEAHLSSFKNAMIGIVIKSGFFSVNYYQSQLTGVKFTSADEAVEHYHAIGWKIGLNPHPLFNTKFYLKNNTDVTERGVNPLFHFIFSGMSENRITSPDFDTDFYTTSYGNFIPSGISAIQHYICYGFAQYFQPLPWIDAITVKAISQQVKHVVSIANCYRMLYRQLKTPHAAMLNASVEKKSLAFDVENVGTDIIIPFYREPYLIKLCLESLHRIADELNTLNCRVIAILDSPEDDDSVEAFNYFTHLVSDKLEIETHINKINSGFVSSVNTGLKKSQSKKRNALLLNSDCILASGSLTEMLRVLALDPMVGFVNPRSNNATIATYPKVVCDLGEHFKSYAAIAHRLPEVSYTPTCVGFCMLISKTVLANFGLLDVSYGAGYNEENDYVSRANKVGFRACQANHAYAFHLGGTSFRHTDFSSSSNADILSGRYPEYQKQINLYFASRAQFAEKIIEGFLPTNEGKFKVLIDISQLGGHPNGTSLMAMRLIREMIQDSQDIEFHVVATPQAIDYNKMSDIENLILHEGWHLIHNQQIKFAHVFRMGQPFSKTDLRNVLTVGATHSFFMLDTIAYDCGYLANEEMQETWESTASIASGFVYQSEFTRSQFQLRFPDMLKKPNLVSYHSLDLKEYRPEVLDVTNTREEEQIKKSGLGGILSSDFVLLVGNHFAHKDVLRTFNQLSVSFPHLTIVVIGNDEMRSRAIDAHGSIFLKSGDIENSVIQLLYANAKAVIFPSFYEGFGLPIFDALSQNRRLFLRDNTINREITQAVGVSSGSNNVVFYADYLDLTLKFAEIVDTGMPDPIRQKNPQSWRSSAIEICDFIRKQIKSWDFEHTYRVFELTRGNR
jgi:GT2 family glycosyltransferase